MIPKHKRAKFIEAFGEKKTKALEDILDTISKAADDAGIERKEAKSLANLFADTVLQATKERQEQENGMIIKDLTTNVGRAEFQGGFNAIMDQLHQLIDRHSTPAQSGPTELKEGESLDAYLRRIMKEGTTKQKAAPPAPAGPSDFAPRTIAGVAPLYGGPANVTKESPQDVNLIDGIFGINQGWGKPAPKNATVLDFIFGLNQKWGK